MGKGVEIPHLSRMGKFGFPIPFWGGGVAISSLQQTTLVRW